jgi:predicted PurR-regulated permease PerM
MDGVFDFWQRIPAQRRKRILLYILAAGLVALTLYAARSVLGLYFLGMVLAYILSPLVDAIQRGVEWISEKTRLRFLRKLARSLAILVSYLILISLIAGFIALVIPIIAKEAQQLWDARDSIWAQVSRWAEQAIEQYELLPDRVRDQIDDAMRNVSTMVTRALQQALQGTFTAISYTMSIVLAIFIVPFWTYFLLRDYGLIRTSLRNSLPQALRKDLRSMATMLDRTIGSYLRGEILLMVIVGVMQTVVLTILGVDYALLLGFLAGLLEVVPNIGPTLAAIPAVLVALTRSPGLALLTIIAANLVQNIENSFIVPRVLGESVGLHPVVMMVMLVIGAEVAGLPGLVLAPILTAVLRDVYRYLNYRFGDEPSCPDEALVRALDREAFTVDL